jgi:hypothetical protein
MATEGHLKMEGSNQRMPLVSLPRIRASMGVFSKDCF